MAKDDVSCQFFVVTLQGDACEWFYSLMLRTITSWDVLEALFVMKYLSRKTTYSLFMKLVEIGMIENES